jgi:hypothetical protein
MTRKTFLAAAVLLSLVVSPWLSLADEGMWLPDSLDRLPLAKLKGRGLQLTAEEIYSTTKPSLKDAVVFISVGGTGSFVSPEGLVLTNHHVAFGAVTAASTPQNDYITNGFLAKSRAEEAPAKGYSLSVTQEFKDVTAEVVGAVTPGMSDAERGRAIAARSAELAKQAAGGREPEGIRTQVVEMLGGTSYYLYTYLVLRDVRMVYVPPKSIGYFGGDPNNFEWPRHCGDFAFLRAYVGPDGKPADFGPQNVPFKPKKFLTLDPGGHKEGDFAMVLGYPGSTFRYRESYSVEYRQKTQLPSVIESYQERIDLLTAAGQRDPELKIKYADEIFSLSNAVKNYRGTVEGIKRADLVARKRAEEAAFARAFEADPALKAKYGEVLPQIAAAYRDLNSFSARSNVLQSILGSGDLFALLSFAYGRALDREKPEAERSPQYSDQAAQQVTAAIGEALKGRSPAVERQLLAAALARADRLPAEERVAWVESLFAGKAGEARRAAEADYARRAVEETKFNTAEAVAKLFAAPAAEIRALEDPAVRLVVQAVDDAAPLEKRTEAFNNAITRLRPLYVRGMLDWKKATPYPDANLTLRFTYGEVKGYRPRDAVTYDHLTSLTGVIEKDTGREPFDVPAKLKDLHTRKDYGGYADPRLKDMPVDLLATTDITGGNSGSALLNGRGEIMGLVFDGNYEGLGSDYVYNPALSRTIAVDIRYVLFVTDKFAGAGYLFGEMQIKRGKAMTASQ